MHRLQICATFARHCFHMPTESPVKVIARPGHLPEFWDRHAVFFANLLGLFFGNEAETESLTQEVGEIDSLVDD